MVRCQRIAQRVVVQVRPGIACVGVSMDRAKLLALIDVTRQRGLEIGPLNRPMVTRETGPIEYVDRAPREELQRWYGGGDVDPEEIVEVDHIWGDQRLIDCVGGRRAFGYLLASHVIEHVPDLLGWLHEIAEVLVDGGIAGFMVPDKRYTFDLLRRTSTGSEVVDAYVRGLRRPDTRQIFDSFHYYRDPETGFDREGHPPTDQRTVRSARELLELCQRAAANGDYIDSHCWVFTPRSMAEALDLTSQLGLLPYEIAALGPTPPGSIEFVLALRRLPDGLDPAARRAAFVASLDRVRLPDELAADQETDLVLARAHQAIGRTAAIEASTSWRITAPLRAAVTMLRRLGGRA
jgi:hypothetical protein